MTTYIQNPNFKSLFNLYNELKDLHQMQRCIFHKINGRSNSHFIQEKFDPSTLSATLVKRFYHSHRLFMEISQYFPTVIKASRTLHISDSVFFDHFIRWLLLQDIDQLSICGIGSYAMDDWK